MRILSLKKNGQIGLTPLGYNKIAKQYDTESYLIEKWDFLGVLYGSRIFEVVWMKKTSCLILDKQFCWSQKVLPNLSLLLLQWPTFISHNFYFLF